jgi:cytochrome c oxidase assembly factor 2
MTSSLFATTVAASFFVVTMPHILPCPVPAVKRADGDVVVDENGRRKVWRCKTGPEVKDGIVQFPSEADTEYDTKRTKRECPVPKPGGILGEWLGFHENDSNTAKKVER